MLLINFFIIAKKVFSFNQRNQGNANQLPGWPSKKQKKTKNQNKTLNKLQRIPGPRFPSFFFLLFSLFINNNFNSQI